MRTMIDLNVMLSEPAAETWIQIMKTGQFNHPQLGEFKITQADLLQFKENFDKKVRGVELAVDVSHEPDKGAVGWFKELKVDTNKLMARVAWTEEGKDLVESGKFRYFSPEFAFTYTDAESGQKFKDVLLGGGITNRPFLKNMAPIELSEDGAYTVLALADGSDKKDKPFDPDHDGDDDSTTDPKQNPDWMQDVKMGITKYPSDKDQIAALTKAGITKEAADAAHAKRNNKPAKLDDQSYTGALPDDNGQGNPPKPTDDVDAGKFSEPPAHINNNPGGGNMGNQDNTPQAGAAQGGAGEQVVSLAEFTAMQNQMKQVMQENKRIKLSETVKGFMFNETTKKGKILPAQENAVIDFMMGLDDAQVAKFSEIVNALPNAIAFGEEHGTGGNGAGQQSKSREDMVSEKATALLSEGKASNPREAFLLADKEIPAVIK